MHSRGSSLVESLVAMSVFGIGSAATGAWFVQALATDARVSRWLAAEATASDLAARMRVNAEGVSAGGYTLSSKAPACVRGCDPVALAGDDMRRFHDALSKQLGPGADGDVHCEMAAACVIRIRWQGQELLVWPVKP